MEKKKIKTRYTRFLESRKKKKEDDERRGFVDLQPKWK